MMFKLITIAFVSVFIAQSASASSVAMYTAAAVSAAMSNHNSGQKKEPETRFSSSPFLHSQDLAEAYKKMSTVNANLNGTYLNAGRKNNVLKMTFKDGTVLAQFDEFKSSKVGIYAKAKYAFHGSALVFSDVMGDASLLPHFGIAVTVTNNELKAIHFRRSFFGSIEDVEVMMEKI